MLLEGGPGPRLVFPGEEVEWANNMGKVWNKFAIEVRKPKERANTFNRNRGFLFLDGRKLDGVHFDLFLANNHAKEFYMRYVKGPFGKLKGQSMFTKTK